MENILLEQGLLQRESSAFGGNILYGNPAASYPCSIGAIGHGARLVAGGFSPNAETVITLRKSAAPGVTFATSHNLTLTDKRGKVTLLQIASEGIQDLVYAWELTCTDVNQGA